MPKRDLVRLARISAGLLCGAVLAAASAVVLHGPAPVLVAVAAAVAAAGATDKGRAAAADAAWKAAAITVTAIVLVAGLGVLAGGAVVAIAGLGSAVVAAVVLLLWARPVRKAWSERHGLLVGAPWTAAAVARPITGPRLAAADVRSCERVAADHCGVGRSAGPEDASGPRPAVAGGPRRARGT